MTRTNRFLLISVALLTAVALAGGFAGGKAESAAATEIPTLRVSVHSGWAATMPQASNDLPVYQELERLTGVRIEWESIMAANYQEVMSARLAAGMNLPDVINMATLGDISRFGRDGLIIPLNDLLESHAPNIMAWFAQPGNEIYRIQATSPDGNIYGVGNYVLPQFLSMGYLWNILWLEELGINKIPETQEEFLAALRAFRDQDPNRTGRADTIPLTPAAGRGYLNILGNQYGFEFSIVSEFNVDDRGRVYWTYQDPRMKEFLGFLNMLYEERLLDRAYATDSWTETAEKVGNDIVGLITCWTTFAGSYSRTHPKGLPDASIPIFVNGPPVEGPYGDKYFVRREISGGDEMAITKDCKTPEVAMHWIDFIRNSEEALMLQNFGIEGKSYNIVDGDIQVIETPDKVFVSRLSELGGGQPPYAHLQWIVGWERRFPMWSIENDRSYADYYKSPSFPQIPATRDETDTLNRRMTDLNTYKLEWFDRFVTGQEPLTRFDEFVAGLNRLGAQEVIAVRQAQYERFLQLMGN